MGRVFVWEASQRAGMGLVFQPAIYAEMPTDGNGPKDMGAKFILIHQELPEEVEWGLLRFADKYPCPASRTIKEGKKDVTEEVQQSSDLKSYADWGGLAGKAGATSSRSGGDGDEPT